MAFTGNRETDKIVLMKLDDYDLANACIVNKHLSEVCKDETFWRNRTLNRFGKYLGNAEQIREYMNNYGYTSWKKYYISLIDFLEKVYDGTVSVKPRRKKLGSRKPGNMPPVKGSIREDIEILKGIIDKNNQEMDERIVKFVDEDYDSWYADSEGAESFELFLDRELNQQMINPNILFTPNDRDEERIGLQIKYLLKSKDKRIRPNYSDYIVLKKFANESDYLEDGLVPGEEVFELLVNDDRIDPNILFEENILGNYQLQFIVRDYLPILANSGRIKFRFYSILLNLFVTDEVVSEEYSQEGELSPSFEEYILETFKNILRRLN